MTHAMHARRGSALVMGTLMIIVLASAATILTTVTLSRFAEQEFRTEDVVLTTTVESIFNEAYAYYQEDATRLPTIDQLGQKIPFEPNPDVSRNHCVVDANVTLTRADKDQWGYKWFKIEATAAIGNLDNRAEHYRRRRIEAIIKPSDEAVLTQAMYSVLGFEFKGSANTDSYNSSESPYTTPPDQSYLNSKGDISSGGSVVAQKPENVHGDVISNKELMLPVMNFTPPGSATAVASPAGSGSLSKDYTFKAPGTYTTNGLDMSGMILRIEGGGTVKLYVNGPVIIDVKHGSALEFDSYSSKLIIYQNDYIGADTQLNGGNDVGQIVPVAGGAATSLSKPEQFIWMTNYSGEIKLNGNAAISACVVAPYATFDMQGGFNFYGAVIAGTFTDKVNGNYYFHYDEALLGLGLGVEPFLQITGWYEHNLSLDQ